MSERRPRVRILTRAEHELWTAVTADVSPFRSSPKRSPEIDPALHAVETPKAETHAAPSPFRDRPQPPRTPTPMEPDIDRRTRVKLRRGRLDVDAKLDLHGMRQAEAQRALHDFLRRAQASGAKIAIVVTGKGLGSEEGGVLRRLVPMWLQAAHMRDVVVGFGEAARNHGGEGALYVRIRRAGRG